TLAEHRAYPEELDGREWVACTLDVVDVGETRIRYWDYKVGPMGRRGREPAESFQLGGGAFIACRAHGKSAATVGFVEWHKDGNLPRFPAVFSSADVARWGERLHTTHAAYVKAWEDAHAGIAPPTNPGELQCRYCDALPNCPAKGQLMQVMLRQQDTITKRFWDLIRDGRQVEAF